MSKYGAKYLQWAPFATTNPEPTGALPNYGAPMNLGGLVKVTDNPTYNDAKAYADNGLAARKQSFKEATIDVEISEISNTVAAALFGATIDETSSNLEYGDDDAPWGGMAFYYGSQDKSGNVTYKGVYFPKVQAAVQGDEYETTGENVTFKNSKAKFIAALCGKGKWRIKSPETFTTEEEAKSWVDGVIKEATAD